MQESSMDTILKKYRLQLSDARARDMGKSSSEAERQLIGYLYDEAIISSQIVDCLSCKTEAFINQDEQMKPWYPWLLFVLLGFTVVFIGLDLRIIGLSFAVASVAFYAYMFALRKKNAPVATATAEMTMLPGEFSRFTQNRVQNLARQSSSIHDLLEQQKQIDSLNSIVGVPELYSFLFEESSFNDSARYALSLCERLLRANDLEPVLDPAQSPDLFVPVVSDNRSGILRPAIRRISNGETIMNGERFVQPEEGKR